MVRDLLGIRRKRGQDRSWSCVQAGNHQFGSGFDAGFQRHRRLTNRSLRLVRPPLTRLQALKPKRHVKPREQVLKARIASSKMATNIYYYEIYEKMENLRFLNFVIFDLSGDQIQTDQKLTVKF